MALEEEHEEEFQLGQIAWYIFVTLSSQNGGSFLIEVWWEQLESNYMFLILWSSRLLAPIIPTELLAEEEPNWRLKLRNHEPLSRGPVFLTAYRPYRLVCLVAGSKYTRPGISLLVCTEGPVAVTEI